MKNTQNIKSDLDLANEALVRLRDNITASDRKEAPANEGTVIRYLKGEGTKLETAVELLNYFRGRIESRRKMILG